MTIGMVTVVVRIGAFMGVVSLLLSGFFDGLEALEKSSVDGAWATGR